MTAAAAKKWIRRRRTPMRMVVVTDSTNIAAIGYALDKLVMCVRFRDGSEYEFEGVSQSAYMKLMNAPSIGSHFANEMRGKYKCWRLKKARPQARTS